MSCLQLTYTAATSNLRLVHSKNDVTSKSCVESERRVYVYGFNGMERDDELSGSGNSYTTFFRQYDPRLGKWISTDPKGFNQPWSSTYVAMGNNPISRIDPQGDTDYEFNKRTGKLKAKGPIDNNPDRIINGKAKYRKDGTLKGGKKKVLQLNGKIENFENGSDYDSEGKFNFQTYKFSNNKDVDKAYSFMAHKTNVEIAKIELKGGNGSTYNRFYTTGSTEEIRGAYGYLQNDVFKNDPGLQLISYTHNHGNPGAGRVGSYNPSSDDKNSAKLYKYNLFKPSRQNTVPVFKIWRLGREQKYDEKGPIP